MLHKFIIIIIIISAEMAVFNVAGYLTEDGRVVMGVGHLGHDEATKAGGREFDPRPGRYSRTRF